MSTIFSPKLALSGFLALTTVFTFDASAQIRTEVTIPKFDTAPVIDGDLSDPCWQEAATITGFSTVLTVEGLIINEALAAVQTTVRVGYDEDNLYFAVDCPEPQPDKIRAKGEKRDYGINKDDHIEIFLQPDLALPEYDHLGVTAKGTLLDHRITIKGGIYDYSWTPNWTVKTKIFKDRWVAEIAMPFADLNHADPQMGREWGFLVGRKRTVGGKECSCWPRIQGLNWHCPHNWARLKGIIIGGREEGTRILGCHTGEARVGRNKLKLQLHTALPEKAQLTANLKITSPAKAVRETTVDLGVVESKGAKIVEIPYAIAAIEGRHTVNISIADGQGRTLCQAPPVTVDIPTFLTGFLDRSYYSREAEAKAHIFLDRLDAAIRRDCRVRGRIVVDGKQAWRGSAPTPLSTKVTLSAELAEVPVGRHTFEAILETGKGKRLSSLSLELKKLEPLAGGTEAKIMLREAGTSIVLVDGKPFFPLGQLNQCPQFCEQILPDAAKAGFNFVQHWKSPVGPGELQRWLDIADKAGIYVMGWSSRLVPRPEKKADRISFSMSKERMRQALVESYLPKLAEAIPQVAGHPALIGWYNFDETPARHVANAVMVAEKVRELDPYHNLLFSSEGGKRLTEASRGGEIFVHDGYLGNSSPMATTYYDALYLKRTCAKHNRVPLMILQLSVSSSLRYMRYEEQRCHSFLALIGSAKGLLWCMDRPHILGPWNDLKRIVGQISKLAPVLLAPDTAQDFTIIQDGPRTVQARLFKKDNDYYLIAANTTIRPTTACFKVKGLKEKAEATEFYQSTNIRADADGLTLKFDSYEVMVYKLRLDR